MGDFYARHVELLDRARTAIRERTYWSPFAEVPSGKIYGETAKADGLKAFEARLGRRFEIDQPNTGREVGAERSPYGRELGIRYPEPDLDALLDAAQRAGAAWGGATVEARLGVCLEILHRLNRGSFEMANAVMHTTGQAFIMAFQAGGPHAQDRGLEAVAYAAEEMLRVPGTARWEKRIGPEQTAVLDKRYRLLPRGVGLVIGCSTFPTWNGYPGLFASLATGNAVVVKPHPGAVLPLALTVETARVVLGEAGFDPNLVTLAADAPDAPVTERLATDPRVGIVDYTGGSAFGDWLAAHATQALLFTEKAGVNSMVIESTDDFRGLCRNVAFSLSLYSGQMCTAPQNLYVPAGGIDSDDGHKSFEEVADGIATGVRKLLGDAARGSSVLGAIQSEATLARVREAAGLGQVVLASEPFVHPDLPDARSVTPTLVRLADDGPDSPARREMFGPISFVIPCADGADGVARAAALAAEKGAITAAVYSTDAALLDAAERAFGGAGVSLSCNLTGGIFVNQSAAFSDYHVSGANPAGNACLTDAAFVAGRFRVVAVRRPAAA